MYSKLNKEIGLLLLVATLAVVPASVLAGPPMIHGIISQGFLNSSDYNYLIPSEQGSFAFNEVLLNIAAPVSDNIRVGAQMMARNLGSAGNENLVLDWAYGDYRLRDEFGIRVGKVKTPFGFYNQTRDVDMVRNSILLPQSVYTESMRDVMNAFEGMSIYGTLGLSSNSSLEYDAFLGTVDVERTQFPMPQMLQPMLAQMHGSSLPSAGWKAETKAVFGSALRWNTPLEGFRCGASVFDGELTGTGTFASPLGYFTPTFNMHAHPWYVLSAEYTTERLILASEFTRVIVDMELDDTLVPTGMSDPASAIMDFKIRDTRGGYYGQATYQVNDWLQLGSYYSMYYPEYHIRDAEGFAYFQRDVALTARVDLADNWLVKIEGHAMGGVGDVSHAINPENPLADENWSLFGVKSTFYF